MHRTETNFRRLLGKVEAMAGNIHTDGFVEHTYVKYIQVLRQQQQELEELFKQHACVWELMLAWRMTVR